MIWFHASNAYDRMSEYGSLYANCWSFVWLQKGTRKNVEFLHEQRDWLWVWTNEIDLMYTNTINNIMIVCIACNVCVILEWKNAATDVLTLEISFSLVSSRCMHFIKYSLQMYKLFVFFGHCSGWIITLDHWLNDIAAVTIEECPHLVEHERNQQII